MALGAPMTVRWGLVVHAFTADRPAVAAGAVVLAIVATTLVVANGPQEPHALAAGAADRASGMFASAFAGTAAALFAGVLAALLSKARPSIGRFVAQAREAQCTIPTLLLALAVLAVSARTWQSVSAAIALVQWPVYCEAAGALAAREGRAAHVEAARNLGLGTTRIVLTHVLPNCSAPLAVVAVMELAAAVAIAAVASLFAAPGAMATISTRTLPPPTAPAEGFALAGAVVVIAGLLLVARALRRALAGRRAP